jgi:Sep-tRNA:Cys-tRNA synthetase
MKCGLSLDVRDIDENSINIDPIQVGGRLTADAMKAVIAYGDGYSVCDNCRKPNRLDMIKSPPIDAFHCDLAVFLNMDEARVVPGARRAFQAVAGTYIEKGDPVLLTALSHYTEFLSVEAYGGVPLEIQKNPENIITADAAGEKIDAVRREYGRPPKLLYIDHFDYQFGNEHEVKGIIKVAKQNDIPVLYNGAYTVGIIPVDGRDLGADFVVGSAHKSMASPAPSGVLAVTKERSEEVFRTTKAQADLTKRTFGIKEVEMMGCTLMGVTLVGMMASFPHVRERVKHWDRHLSNGRMIVDALLAIDGTVVKSEYPRKHTLTRIDTTGSFDIVARTHKKRGFFLTSALKEKGIAGTIPGATKVWKFNTYGMTDAQARYTAKAFQDIALQNGLPVSL